MRTAIIIEKGARGNALVQRVFDRKAHEISPDVFFAGERETSPNVQIKTTGSPGRDQIEKLVPQPQAAVALGFLIWKLAPISSST